MKRLAIVAVLACWTPALATSRPINATSITINGVAPPGPRHLNDTTPTIAWTAQGTQTNWQVCVGRASVSRCFYCDSGTTPASGSDTTYTVCSPGSLGTEVPWVAHEILVSVRTAENGEAITAQPWVETTYHTQENPKPPIITRISVSSDPNLDAAASQSWPSAGADIEDWYADPNSAVTTPCTIGTPCTLQGALNKIDSKGDTVHLACGSYLGAFTVPSQNGDATNPITIKSVTDGCAYVQSTTCNPALFLNSRSFYVIDGLVMSNSGGASCNPASAGAGAGDSLRITGGGNHKIVRWHSDPNTDPTKSNGIQFDSASSDNIVTLSQFTDRMFDGIDAQGCSRCTFSYNYFTNANTTAHVAIEAHGSQLSHGTGITIEGNVFENFQSSSGVLALYNSTNGTVRYNAFIHTTQSGGFGPAVSLIRSDHAVVEHNSFYDSWAHLSFSTGVRDTVVRNNIFAKSSLAGITWGRDSQFDGDSTPGVAIEYNTFCGNVLDYEFKAAHPIDVANIATLDNNNCKAGDGVACAGNACDPKYHSAVDLNLDAGSYAIDRAKRDGAPIPTGGGSRGDLGAYEVGSSGAPAYASWQSSFTVSSGTPRVDWLYVDGSNRALAREPWAWFGTTGDKGTVFECMVDSAITFDSQAGGHPKIWTAATTVDPPHYGWNVAAADTLSAGQWFVRCSVRDSHVTTISGTSAWSQPVAFTVQ